MLLDGIRFSDSPNLRVQHYLRSLQSVVMHNSFLCLTITRYIRAEMFQLSKGLVADSRRSGSRPSIVPSKAVGWVGIVVEKIWRWRRRMGNGSD